MLHVTCKTLVYDLKRRDYHLSDGPRWRSPGDM